MDSKTYGIVLLVCAVSLLTAGIAGAELKVSVTLSGSVDELLPIIQHLKDMGVGLGAQAGEAVKLEVHSVITRGEGVADEAPAPEPALALLNPHVEPTAPNPSEEVLIVVRVSDPEHKVDTVAGRFRRYDFDLYDDGTHGDKVAGDGTWSYAYVLPTDATPGAYTFTIRAFDVHGDPVMREEEDGSASQLATKGKFTVSE